MRPLLLAVAIALAGCGALEERVVDAEHRLVELDLRLSSAEKQLATLEALEGRVAGLEHASAPAAVEEDQRLSLEARLEQLLLRVGRLERARPEGSAGSGGQKRISVPTTKAPPSGSKVDVVSIGAGDLILARVKGKLERLRLDGLEAPLQSNDYRRLPALHLRHEAAFGRRLSGDAAWAASRDHLAKTLDGVQVTLSYPAGGPRRTAQGGLIVVLVAGELDVGRRLVTAGYVLATSERYRHAERAARGGKLGLFAKE